MKLKTLKDIPTFREGGLNFVSKEDLKQKAIKWVKENIIQETDLWSQGRNMGVMKMAEFLNITESDLKESEGGKE